MSERITYIYRKVDIDNSNQFITWFNKNIGLDPSKLHVTVAYSRTEINITEDELDKNSLIVLGDKLIKLDSGANALSIRSNHLINQFLKYKNLGASYDYEEYLPHITLFYDGDKIINLSELKYSSSITLSPEFIKILDK